MCRRRAIESRLSWYHAAIFILLGSSLYAQNENRGQSGESNRKLPENYHALYDSSLLPADRAARATEATPTKGHAALQESFRDLKVTYDEVLRIPNRVTRTSPNARVSRAAQSAEDAASAFIQEHREVWNLSPADASTVEVVGVSERGLKAVRMKQRVGGVEVFGSDINVAVSSMNEVTAVSGIVFPGSGAESSRRAMARSSSTTDEMAIAQALYDLAGVGLRAENFKAQEQRSGNRESRFYETQATDQKMERPVRVKDVMFPMSDGTFIPAYYMELWPLGAPAYSYVIAADDSKKILFRNNLTSHIAFDYRVHNTGDTLFHPLDGPAPGSPHPTGQPNGFQAPVVVERVIRIESLLTGDPWLPHTATTTDGNNCIAYADLSAPDGFQASSNDVMGKITSPGAFDYTYDHAKAASDPTNLQNSLVGMFFHVNWLHDRWYAAGFDEAAGNAQRDNFGRGGQDGDHILAEGNDFSGTDNADMSTPSDGASPRMQMFEFKGPPGPSRTSNHEALITFHEMGHYITNRLVGNANGLGNRQGRAMGEGWGDFFAACMTSNPTDNFQSGVFAVGGWTDITPTFKDNYYFSIRRYPYSADLSKNPLTFKHISLETSLPSGPQAPKRNPTPGNPQNNEVHNAGEVWCTALWEVFVKLVAIHGQEVAETRMLEYVIGGLKQTPSNPTFTEARDGIITAVTALHADDLKPVWQGFAKRGMGADAVSPPRTSPTLNGVVESFAVPAEFSERSSSEPVPPQLVLIDGDRTLEANGQLRPGAVDLMRTITQMKDEHGQAPALALVSNYYPASNESEAKSHRQQYLERLEQLKLSSYFQPADQRVTLSSDLSMIQPNVGTPDPRLFQLALENAGANRKLQEVIFVSGDLEHVNAARAIGMRSLHVTAAGLQDAAVAKQPARDLVAMFSNYTDGVQPALAQARTARSADDNVTIVLGDQRYQASPSTDQRSATSGPMLMAVVQTGSAFERAHPEAKVLVNRGRHLLVDGRTLIDKRAAQAGLAPAGLAPTDDDHDFKMTPITSSTTIFQRTNAADLRAAPNDKVVQLLSSLNADQFKADVITLAAFPNRHSTTANYANASTWAADQLQSLGYTVKFDPIIVNGKPSRNVVATKAGQSADAKILLVAAHLDSINHFSGPPPLAEAPGADDNASGTAGVLQIARALKNAAGKHELKFILFGGEEEGLFGSTQYVQRLSQAEKARIKCVVNMDMISTKNQSTSSVLVEGSDNTSAMKDLVNEVVAAAATYSQLQVDISFNPFNSDHVPFIDAGIPAVLTIEGADSANNNVHTINDSVDKVDAQYAIEILKMNLAFIASKLEQD